MIDISNVDDLRRVYLYIFDAFAASNTEIASANKGINIRYARELAATLQNGGLVYLTEDGEGSDAWQAVDTHDSITHDEAEAKFNEWAQVKPPAPRSATTPACRSALRSDATGPHPCLCGCGDEISTRAVYRPGHDARHAGEVGREIAANYDTEGFDRRELLATLGSDKLRAKAERIAEKATDKATKHTPVNLAWVEGSVTVGKHEYLGRKNSVSGAVEYTKPGSTLWQPASKTAARTFQKG